MHFVHMLLIQALSLAAPTHVKKIEKQYNCRIQKAADTVKAKLKISEYHRCSNRGARGL